MASRQPITTIEQLNGEVEDLEDRALEGGIDRATLASVFARRVTGNGSKLMRERSGAEFNVAKAIQQGGQLAGNMATSLRE